MHNFVYEIPTKVYFGQDQINNLGKEVLKYGKNVLITYGGGSIIKNGLYDKVVSILKNHDINIYKLSGIKPNPRIESVKEGAKICKENNIDVILAIGGGSTIDASKFIAASACSDIDPWDFFSKKAPITNVLPIITILTLAATGSEMNSTGVLSNTQTNQKMGRDSELLIPKVSFLDPTNTFTVDKYQTACGSADILAHIIEVYFNNENDLYMLDSIMEALMKTVIKFTPIALNKPDDYTARANLMWASSWAINGFIDGAKQHSWSAHSIEHQLSAYYDITHGLGLAIIIPKWLNYCLSENTVDKYCQFAINVFNINPNLDKFEIAKLGIEKLSDFFYSTLNLNKTLSEINIDDTYFEEMAKKACKGDKINGFKTLTETDVINIYKMCL